MSTITGLPLSVGCAAPTLAPIGAVYCFSRNPESVAWVVDPHDGLKSTLRRERADEPRGVQLAQGTVLDEVLGRQRGGVLRADGAQDRPHALRLALPNEQPRVPYERLLDQL